MRWSDADPEGALAWSEKKGGGQSDYFMKHESALLAYSAMAERDPVDTLAQVQAMPPGPRRDLALAAVVGQLAKTDPALALKLNAETHGAADQMDGLAGGDAQIFSEWAGAHDHGPHEDRDDQRLSRHQ